MFFIQTSVNKFLNLEKHSKTLFQITFLHPKTFRPKWTVFAKLFDFSRESKVFFSETTDCISRTWVSVDFSATREKVPKLLDCYQSICFFCNGNLIGHNSQKLRIGPIWLDKQSPLPSIQLWVIVLSSSQSADLLLHKMIQYHCSFYQTVSRTGWA